MYFYSHDFILIECIVSRFLSSNLPNRNHPPTVVQYSSSTLGPPPPFILWQVESCHSFLLSEGISFCWQQSGGQFSPFFSIDYHVRKDDLQSHRTLFRRTRRLIIFVKYLISLCFLPKTLSENSKQIFGRL